MNNSERSSAIKGTVTLLVINAVLGLSFLFEPEVGDLFTITVVLSAVQLVVAYLCWDQRKLGFMLAIILALFNIVGTVAYNPTIDLWLIMPTALQLILIFFGFRAYREFEKS